MFDWLHRQLGDQAEMTMEEYVRERGYGSRLIRGSHPFIGLTTQKEECDEEKRDRVHSGDQECGRDN